MYRALTAFISSQKVKFVFEQPNPEDLVFLKELIESGKIHVVINCTYTLVQVAAPEDCSKSEHPVGGNCVGAARRRHRS